MQDELVRRLAGRRGHFEMESGYHSEWWFDLDKLFQSPAHSLEPFVAELSRHLGAHRPDAVCGPMTGGAKLAERIAAALGVSYFFTERREHPGKTGLFPVEYVLPEKQRAEAEGKLSPSSTTRSAQARRCAERKRPCSRVARGRWR